MSNQETTYKLLKRYHAACCRCRELYEANQCLVAAMAQEEATTTKLLAVVTRQRRELAVLKSAYMAIKVLVMLVCIVFVVATAIGVFCGGWR